MVISKLRDGINGGLVTHAAGEQIDALGTRLGVPRPPYLTRTAWRRAISAANSYRTEPNAFQFFLEGALSDFATLLEVVLDPSRPNQIVSPSAEFTQDLVGRTVRLAGYGLFRVVGPADVTATPFRSEILALCEVETPSWQVPSWQDLAAPVEVGAEFHAFLVREDQAGPSTQTVGDESGTVTVYVYPEAHTPVPPSFLLPLQEGLPEPEEEGDLDPQPASNWPDGVPYGSGLLVDDTIIESDEVWPFFLAADGIMPELVFAMENMLDAGFKVKFRPLPTLG